MSQGDPDSRQLMLREELEAALRVAVAVTVERVRRQLRGRRKDYARLRRWFEERFPAPRLNIKVIRAATRCRGPCLPGAKTLGAYLAEQRARTVRQMVELGDGLISVGRAAAAVGFSSLKAWSRADELLAGQRPKLARPARIRLRLDAATWHHACLRALSVDEVRALLWRLRWLYPGALWLEPPVVRPLPRLRRPLSAVRDSGGSEAAARAAARAAAARPRARMLGDARDLPATPGGVLADAAEHLLKSGLKVSSCCRRKGIRDKGISTQILFYLGDTLLEAIERRRIETALPLVADRRFSIDKIARSVGMSYKCFLGAFTKRTGAPAWEVRSAACATSGHAAYRLWHEAENGRLTDVEVRWLAGCLRGLRPAAFERPAMPPLAVRRDIDVADVEVILELNRAVWTDAIAALARKFAAQPEGAAAQWYARWVRDRLGRADLTVAWMEWQAANRRLEKLLELPPGERLAVVGRDPECQSDAFLWLLVDCVGVRLFHDAVESEHFADLAVAAVEGRGESDGLPEAEGIRALVGALKANAVRRRNELDTAAERFEEVFEILEETEVHPWIKGRICKLYGSLLHRKGEEQEAFRTLGDAARRFKDADDQLERVRCLIGRASAWFAKGRDPSRLLTACIPILDRYPFATELREGIHLNRILATIYLTDQLNGLQLAKIRSFRAAMPPAGSAYVAAEYQQVDGLIAALERQAEVAAATLERAASWFEEHDLLADAATTWLLYSWAVLVIDAGAATLAAKTAYAYMERTGFRSQGVEKVARKIYQDAQRGDLSRGLLRRGILLMVCPRIEDRLGAEAKPR